MAGSRQVTTSKFVISRRAAGVGLLAAATIAPVRADVDVDLLLVMAVDASGSVNQQRFQLQKDGYAAAFRDKDVLDAIRNNRRGAIAITMSQWTGPTLQQQSVPWMRISDEESIEQVAVAIDRSRRILFGGGTSISGAIDHAMGLLRQAPYAAPRRVIDVSGDGSNNRGRPAALARDDAIAAEVTINGLPILSIESDLDTYYQDNVIGGPDAFMVVAEDYETFAAAVRRKLIKEISEHNGELIDRA